MMHTITSHSRENRMTSSAVAACMSPLLLRPLLAGECDLEGFDALEDNSAQLLAAANAANNAQAIVTSLLEDYGNMINVRSFNLYLVPHNTICSTILFAG